MSKTSTTPQATTPANRLIAPRFVFRFSVDVHRREPLWPVRGVKVKGPLLDPSYRLITPGELDGERTLADVRMGWSPEGLLWTVQVEGKRQTPWCRESRPTESDGLQVWIDTRASRDIHRANRYCHRFVYLPCGAGRGAAEPIAEQLLIHRARENARPVRPHELQVRAKTTSKGYELAAFAPAQVLAGFDPVNQPRLGFTLAVLDRELGLQTFATGVEFPYEENPSCWAELELVE